MAPTPGTSAVTLDAAAIKRIEAIVEDSITPFRKLQKEHMDKVLEVDKRLTGRMNLLDITVSALKGEVSLIANQLLDVSSRIEKTIEMLRAFEEGKDTNVAVRFTSSMDRAGVVHPARPTDWAHVEAQLRAMQRTVDGMEAFKEKLYMEVMGKVDTLRGRYGRMAGEQDSFEMQRQGMAVVGKVGGGGGTDRRRGSGDAAKGGEGDWGARGRGGRRGGGTCRDGGGVGGSDECGAACGGERIVGAGGVFKFNR
jgi:hypothetical protein